MAFKDSFLFLAITSSIFIIFYLFFIIYVNYIFHFIIIAFYIKIAYKSVELLILKKICHSLVN